MKSLIIRTSYSKLPNGEIKSNFGDLIRCTIILSCIKEDYIWLTDNRGKELLKYFLPEEKILTPKDFSGFLEEEFVVYNLDNYAFDKDIFFKLKGIWKGFILKEKEVIPENEKIEMIQSYFKTNLEMSWQQTFIEGLGFVWKEQDYLTPKISGEIKYDIGFNNNVHIEWNSKKWPEEYWFKLKEMLKKDYSVSFQEGLDNFEEYLKWISSCKLIITPDTLGLHLASSLRKKVILITGPTDNHEYSYGRITFLFPKKRDCMPCNSKNCKYDKTCITEITPEIVYEEIIKLF